MQYILTKEEYDSLINQIDSAKKENTSIFQSLCTQIAELKPVPRPWAGEDAEPQPWGCILSKEHDSGYCDDCPVWEICPNKYKEWSK